jgi:phosphoenolpyruvate-protein kinase (PTS system EI component)
MNQPQEGPPLSTEEQAPSFIIDADACFLLHAALHKDSDKISETLSQVEQEIKPEYALVQEYKDIMQMLGEAREATTSSRLKASSAGQNVCTHPRRPLHPYSNTD